MKGSKKSRLSDLDLGESPTVNAANQAATWTDEDSTLYYPLIDYGSFEGRASTHNVAVERILPGVRVHRVVASIYMALGFSVRVVGRLSRLWKKLILPFVSGEVQIDARYLVGNTSLVYQSGTQSYTPNPIFPPIVINATAIFDDPGGNISGPYYVPPFTMAMQATITLRLKATWSTTGSHTVVFGLWDFSTSTAYSLPVFFHTSGTTLEVNTQFVINSLFYLPAGDNIGLGVWRSSPPPGVTLDAFEVYECAVEWKPTNIQYQEGLTFDIASTLPDLTYGELLKGIANWGNIVFSTDDQTKEVTIQFYDDLLKGIDDGEDWSDRMDGFPTKIKDDAAARYLFTFKGDRKDRLRVEDEALNPERPLGDHTYEAGGSGDEEEIELPFAATYANDTFNGVTIPALYKENGTYQTDYYEYEPRILIADGLQPGEWTFDSVLQTEYPFVYFADPSGAFNLSFDNELSRGTPIQGTVAAYWTDRLRTMVDGVKLQADVFIHDYEVQGFDVGVPRLMNDGLVDGWYYVFEISGKTFGDGAPCGCLLIPL